MTILRHLVLALALWGFALPSFAQVSTQRITLTISITNQPVTSNTLVVNSSTRTWTNISTAATIPTNLVSTAASATNLYNQIASFPYSGGIAPRWLTETSMTLIAPLGGALSASQSGAWAILTLSTQSGPNTFTALWPLENIAGPAVNKTNQASAFVSGLGQFSTNAFPTNSTATSNFITKGASPEQHIASPLRVTGTLRATSQILATNGFFSGTTNINPVFSNAVNTGNALRSEGSGGNSFQVGSNALAIGDLSVAVGNGASAQTNDATAVGNNSIAMGYRSVAFGQGAVASNQFATAVGQASFAGRNSAAFGQGAKATNEQSLAVGIGSVADGTNSIAIGVEATATVYQSAAIGDASSAAHIRGLALGAGAATDTTNQIKLGTSTETVSIPGQLLISGTQSNTTFTGTNVLNGRVDATPRNNTALANGYNSAVVFGTNVVVRFSGPSAAYTNAGFLAPGGPQIVYGQFDNPGLSFTLLDESGIEATPANRILTGTGDLLNSTNRVAIGAFLYDMTASRWRVISFR